MDVRLQHDDPYARRYKLCLAVVEVCRNVPESYADEEAVEHVQDKLCTNQNEGGIRNDARLDVFFCVEMGGGLYSFFRLHRTRLAKYQA